MAAALALAYALCVLAPPFALAAMGNADALHCLTNGHQHHFAAANADQTAAHGSHAAHAPHEAGHVEGGRHDPGESAGGEPGVTCCGYFCLSAIAATPVPASDPQERVLPSASRIARSLAGRGPGRIDRPPIPVLPL